MTAGAGEEPLLDPVGEKRGRHYLPSESLRVLEQEIRAMQPWQRG